MQTSVSTDYTLGSAGQMADLHTALDGDITSYTSEEASAEIPFGYVVKQGAADNGALLPTANTNKLLGLVVFSHMFAHGVVGADAAIGPSGGLLPDITFGVGRKGRFLVLPTEDVTPASAVRVQVVAETNHPAGSFGKTASAGKTVDCSAFAKWRSTATAGNPAVVEVDFTNEALKAAD